MSQMHATFGHFSRPVKRELSRTYKLCPCCGRPAENFDHIFPLNMLDLLGPNAAAQFGVADIHAIENGWRICTICHAKKSGEEFAAYPHGDKLSAVYNKWWKKAFTPTGKRRLWKGPLNRDGLRKRRNARLIARRNRAKIKVA